MALNLTSRLLIAVAAVAALIAAAPRSSPIAVTGDGRFVAANPDSCLSPSSTRSGAKSNAEVKLSGTPQTVCIAPDDARAASAAPSLL